jgi:hypothetical protein
MAIEKLTRYRGRAMAAFIMDDLSGSLPEDAAAFRKFSRWVCEAGIKGECSVILGLRRTEDGRALPQQEGFIEDLLAAKDHLDTFMEVMTHSYLYDFAADRIRTDGPHEGVWMLDRSRPFEEYLAYFRGIAGRAAREGFRHAGLTLPGCGCGPCAEFYGQGRVREAASDLSPRLTKALLQVMSEGLLAGSVCGTFVGSEGAGPDDVRLLDEDGAQGVYDVPPGVRGDHFGRWDNNPEHRDPDFYITEDGERGRLVQLLAQGTRTLVYYGHWQSLRPDRGIGFEPFGQVAARLGKHHGDRLVWMRPSQIAAYRHTERHTELRAAADGKSFELRIPFAPLHPISFRLVGEGSPRLKTPGGAVLAADEQAGGANVFSFLPQNGRYEVL